MKGLNVSKHIAAILLILLTSAMFLLAFNLGAYAQEDQSQIPQVPNPQYTPTPPPAPQKVAIVVVVASVGGTTDPAPGTYTYAEGETINLEATASDGFKFLYWIISGSYTPGHNLQPITYPVNAVDDPNYIPPVPSPSLVAVDNLVTSLNPLKVICGYGYTYSYQPVFAPTTEPAATSDAIVVMLDSIGGATDPGPGTYRYSNGSTIVLKATPDEGYDFVYWVTVGADGHPYTFIDNPTSIICGYGYTYSYQPMFAPSGAAPPSAGVSIEYLVVIGVLVIVAVIAVAAAVMYRGKSKK
jgi:hypothetical protein